VPENFCDAHYGDVFSSDNLLLVLAGHLCAAESGEGCAGEAGVECGNHLSPVCVAGGFAGREEDARIGDGGDGLSLSSFVAGRGCGAANMVGEMNARAMKAEKRFQAVLEKERGLGWTIVRVPFDPAKAWPKMIRLRVRGEVNGAVFRTSLFADGNGYFLLVNRETQKSARVGFGDSVEIMLEPDLEPRPAELPDVLEALLEDEAGLRKWYDGLSESQRREIGKWVLGVKSDQARMRRAQQMAERLMATMEAEAELPPVVARALRSRTKAKAGWERMTPTQRRSELMGVFYYQTPEARERRVQKLVEAAERRAGDD
jgi:uncharacterized protein YdeI (YjbR/CyaY-like superfamily)